MAGRGAPAADSNDVTAKLVLLGETAVGKSSIACRFVRNDFIQNHESTIGAAFLSHTVDLAEGNVKFEIWDTAGQERYRSLAPMYYRNAVAALVVYDITAADSLRRAKEWMKELRKTSDTIIIALLGNKCDLEEKRAVPRKEGEETAAEEKVLFFETSAMTNHNVDQAFRAVAQRVLASGVAAPVRGAGQEPPGSSKVRPGGKPKPKPKSSSPCGCKK